MGNAYFCGICDEALEVNEYDFILVIFALLLLIMASVAFYLSSH